MHIQTINSMMMDQAPYLVEYLVRQIDSPQESIFVAMFLHRIVRQLMSVRLDHYSAVAKIKSKKKRKIRKKYTKFDVKLNG